MASSMSLGEEMAANLKKVGKYPIPSFSKTDLVTNQVSKLPKESGKSKLYLANTLHDIVLVAKLFKLFNRLDEIKRIDSVCNNCV